ncbi:MAG: hypothetical protein SW833_02835 [Cyanobacteriota bacterium]|nr:hypothetical protein [Cyanobacteriota bacterium]
MPPQKAQKIEFNRDYPCPCRRRGTLQPIALTEALGCDLCQQIFVVEENGSAIEQLSTTYPYKRSWRWTGSRWIRATDRLKASLLPVVVAGGALMLLLGLPLVLRSPSIDIIVWVMVAIFLAILFTLILWLSYRR